MSYTCTIKTPLGPMTAAADEHALTGLWFVGQKHYPQNTGGWIKEPARPLFQKLQTWIDNYFAGKKQKPDFKLTPAGTVFQKQVWDELLNIPYGKTITYGDIAKTIANRNGKTTSSARAAGSAVGRNPISIIIPCHRVIGSTNKLTGYAGGLDRKEALLKREGVIF